MYLPSVNFCGRVYNKVYDTVNIVYNNLVNKVNTLPRSTVWTCQIKILALFNIHTLLYIIIYLMLHISKIAI